MHVFFFFVRIVRTIIGTAHVAGFIRAASESTVYSYLHRWNCEQSDCQVVYRKA